MALAFAPAPREEEEELLLPPCSPSTPRPQAPPWAEVALSVYELHGAEALNAVTELVGLGGAYHVGLEVYWLEWSYGRSDVGTGVHVVPLGKSTTGTFKERVSLGRTPLPLDKVFDVLAYMRQRWLGTDYHFLRRNCGHFCIELARRLRVPSKVPRWAISLAEHGDWLTQWFGDDAAAAAALCCGRGEEEMDGEALLKLLRLDPVVAKHELEWYWSQVRGDVRAEEALLPPPPPQWTTVPPGLELL